MKRRASEPASDAFTLPLPRLARVRPRSHARAPCAAVRLRRPAVVSPWMWFEGGQWVPSACGVHCAAGPMPTARNNPACHLFVQALCCSIPVALTRRSSSRAKRSSRLLLSSASFASRSRRSAALSPGSEVSESKPPRESASPLAAAGAAGAVGAPGAVGVPGRAGFFCTAGVAGAPLQVTSALPRRVTLMIGFYQRDVNSELPRRMLYSACGPTPRATRACTWPTILASADGKGATHTHDQAKDGDMSVRPIRHGVAMVSPAWDSIPPRRNTESKDPWDGKGLCVPDERNNHYFVRGMQEFLFDHLDGSCH